MESKKTLYTVVYEELRKQILSGQREYGSVFPSIKQLCGIYHVGIRTIKTVLGMLKQEGLIHTQERKRAIVIYKSPYIENQRLQVCALMGRKDSILSVYKTMEVLMPEIISFCTRFCRLAELEHYEHAVEIRKKKGGTECWRILSALIHDILRSSGNVLFRSMYASLELYGEMPFFMEHQQAITSYTLDEDIHDTDWFFETMKNSSPYVVKSHFQAFYHKVTQFIQTSFDKLAVQFPLPAYVKEDYFLWNVQHGRNYLYRQLVRELIVKIRMGIYRPGDFLPSEVALANDYTVSVSTVRKAIATLNRMGFCQTINGKGTLVMRHDEKAVSLADMAPEYGEEAFLYLSGVQLMALVIRPAALQVFDRLDKDVQQQLAYQCSEMGCNPLKSILTCMLEKLQLYPLKTILLETNKIMEWGFGYIAYQTMYPNMGQVNIIGHRALYCLKKGDRQGFADNLRRGYSNILCCTRDLLVKIGLTEAAHIESPA